MQKQQFPLLLAVLVALFATLAVACGGGDDDPIAATSTLAPQATLSPAEELEQATRAIDSSQARQTYVATEEALRWLVSIL